MKVIGVFVFCMVTLINGNEIDTNELSSSKVDSPPSVSDKKSRLISFNNDHGEVKIELDFAVPFMNIPVKPKSIGGHGEVLEPLLEINTRGLVTVGTILFFLITVVPKLVKVFIPQAHATVTDGFMPLMARIDEALNTMNVPTTECYQRSACWVGSNTLIKPSYLETFSPEWLQNTLDTPEIQEALRRGQNGEDCSVYKCSIPIQAMSKLVTMGKGMFSHQT